MTEELVHTNTFNAPVDAVFAVIASSTGHSAMTGAPADIGAVAGETFTTHGGAIEGVMLDVAENERIVQAWRPADWPAGQFSVVRYDFAAAGDSTELTLTHTAIPEGAAEHLEGGWNERYWAPLAEYLESA